MAAHPHQFSFIVTTPTPTMESRSTHASWQKQRKFNIQCPLLEKVLILGKIFVSLNLKTLFEINKFSFHAITV